jgi:hypothetical protein
MVEPENAPEAAQPLIEAGKQQTGGEVINFFKQMSVSPTTFKAYMDFSGTMQGGRARPSDAGVDRRRHLGL